MRLFVKQHWHLELNQYRRVNSYKLLILATLETLPGKCQEKCRIGRSEIFGITTDKMPEGRDQRRNSELSLK